MRTLLEFEVEPDLEAFKAAKALMKDRELSGIDELTRLAERGSILSMLEIGRAYYSGTGVLKDYAHSEEWFRRAANARSVLGHYYLGLVQKKTARVVDAIASFNFSASRGYGPALYELGKIYFYGEGVTKDSRLASQYLAKASQAGMVHATALLAHNEIRTAPNLAIKARGYLKLLRAMSKGVFLTFYENPDSQKLIR